ncbi:hypothetical protein J3F84DRAFT_242691 [Trichoderma pleuroticola]
MQVLVLLAVLPGMLPAKAAIGKSSKSLALHDIRHHSECSATYPNLRLLPRPVPQVADTSDYPELMIIRSLRQKRSTKLASMQLLEAVLGTENFRNHQRFQSHEAPRTTTAS